MFFWSERNDHNVITAQFFQGKLTNPAFAAHLLEEVGHLELNTTSTILNRPVSSASFAKVIKRAISSESFHSVLHKSERMISSLSVVKRDRAEVSRCFSRYIK